MVLPHLLRCRPRRARRTWTWTRKLQLDRWSWDPLRLFRRPTASPRCCPSLFIHFNPAALFSDSFLLLLLLCFCFFFLRVRHHCTAQNPTDLVRLQGSQ